MIHEAVILTGEDLAHALRGAAWRCREKGDGWCELDDEPPEYVAEYAVPSASFLACFEQRLLEARGQLRLPILKDDVL